MIKTLKIAILSLVTLALAGCSTILPAPESKEDTLVLAPFAADTSSKSSNAWLYDYILNNDENTFFRINSRRVGGDFALQTGLPEGEYTITAIRSVPKSIGRVKAIGETRTSNLPAEQQVSFEVKANKVTIIPLKIIFKQIRDQSHYYTTLDFAWLTEAELEQERAKALELEGIEHWEMVK